MTYVCYTILRTSKNPSETDEVWNKIKKSVVDYLTLKGAELHIITNLEKTKILNIYCPNINIKIEFYTGHLTQDSEVNDLLSLSKDSKIIDVIKLNNINDDFYKNIK